MGLALVLSILFTAILIFHRKKEAAKLVPNSPDEQKTNGFDDFIALLLGRPNSTIAQEIIKSPDLDAIQFENDYKEILINEKLNQKRVVIAIDNLDRLPEEKLEAAWGSIQVFANQRTATLLGTRRPWIILPIARRAFDQLSKSEGDSKRVGIGAISKLFVRQFEIPTPIITDWKKCFTGYLVQAFPAISEKEVQQVFSIANSLEAGRIERTPREAIRFINSMVSIAKLHSGLEMSSYALYALITSSQTDGNGLDNSKKQSILLGRDNMAYSHLDICYGDNVQHGLDELAMMMYGVFTPEAAREIFISREVDRAIGEQTDLDIQAIVENKSGAWNTLTEILSSEIGYAESRTNNRWISRFYDNFQNYADAGGNNENLKRIQRKLIGALPQGNWPIEAGFALRMKDTLFDSRFGSHQRMSILKFIIGTSTEWAKKLQESDSPEANRQFQLWAIETAEVLNAYEEKDELPQSLGFAEFRDNYWKLLKGLAQASSNITWFGRIDVNPTVAFHSILDGMIEDEHVYSDSENELALWNLIKQSLVLDIDTEANPIDLTTYSSDKDKSLKLFFIYWIAKNVHGITLPLQDSYLENYQIQQADSERIFGSFETYSPDCRIALVDHLLEKSAIDDYESHATNLLATAPDFSIVAERYRTLFDEQFEYLIAYMNNTDIAKIAKGLLEQFWTEEAYSSQPLPICLGYAEKLSPGEMITFGEQLAHARRESDLITSTFNHNLKVFYLGFCNVGGSDAFKKWISKGLDTTTVKDWGNWLENMGSSTMRLVRYCNYAPKSLIDYAIQCLNSNHLELIINHKLMGGIIATQELTGALDAAINDDQENRWKSIIKAVGREPTFQEWFAQTSVNTRMKILELIYKENTTELYVWFADMLGSRNQARTFLHGKISEARRLLNRAVKRKIPETKKEACRRILAVLA
jgi:hypothetical protein